MTEEGTARFAREWNFAFALVAAVAVLFVAAGYVWLGASVGGLCVAAWAARYRAMRRLGRGFYGQTKHAR